MLADYAKIIGETYTGFLSVDGGGCEIAGYPLTEIWSPVLRLAFLEFMELANPQGVYCDPESRDGLALLERPALNTPHTTTVRVDHDRPISAWGFLHLGDGFKRFGAYVPRTIGDFPAQPVARGVCENYAALLELGRPAVCRVSGVNSAGATTMYDRLWLPIANRNGPISGFMTIADVTLGLTLPDGTIVDGAVPTGAPGGAASVGAERLSGSGRFR